MYQIAAALKQKPRRKKQLC